MSSGPVAALTALALSVVVASGQAQTGREGPDDIGRKAIRLARAGDAQQSESLARRAVAMRPGDPGMLAVLGGVLAMAGKHDEACDAFGQALQADPANLRMRRDLAACQWQAGRLAQARLNVAAVLEESPDDRRSLVLAGMIAENQGRHLPAARLLEQSGPAAFGRPEPMLALARSYYKLGRPEGARKVLVRLEKAGAGPEIYAAAATAAFEAGDYDPAARFFRAALRSGHTARGRMRFNSALSQYRAGHFARARATLDELLGEEPDYDDAWNLLGWCFEAEGESAKAVRALEKAVKVSPATERHRIDLGSILVAHRESWHLALRTAEQGLRRFPNSFRLHQLLGLARLRQQHYLDAAASYERASELAPESPEVQLGLIVSLWASGQIDQALQTARSGIEAFPTDATLRLQLGRMRLEQAEWGDPAATGLAAARLDEALALDPKLAEAHYEQGRLALRLGNFEEALANLQTATGLAPRNRNAHYLLARCLRRLGRDSEAAQAMQVFADLADEEETGGHGLAIR